MNEPANFDTNGERPWNWPEKDKPYWSLKCTLDNNTLDIPPYKPSKFVIIYISEYFIHYCLLVKKSKYLRLKF